MISLIKKMAHKVKTKLKGINVKTVNLIAG